MKIKLLMCFCIIIIGHQSFGQEVIARFKAKNGKWGYMTVKGEVLIEPKYGDGVGPFKSGMARIDLTHFINNKGERIFTKHRVIKARHYSNGLVAIKTTKEWGYMNRKGELKIPDIYEVATDFNGNFATVKEKKKKEWYIIDTVGQKILIQANNKKVTNLRRFSEGLAPIAIGRLWGFVNVKGEITIAPSFLGVGYYVQGMAWARNLEGKIGFIDKKGEWKIDPQFSSVSNFDPVSGLAKIKMIGGPGYVTTKGEIKRFENTREHRPFYSGLSLESEKMGKSKFGFIDKEGNWAIEPKFWIITKFIGDYAEMRENGKWGIINKKGEWVLKPTYKMIKLNRTKSIVGMILQIRIE